MDARGKATHPMIRFQVVNLLAEDQGPEVLAQELDDVEWFDEARLVFGESRWLWLTS